MPRTSHPVLLTFIMCIAQVGTLVDAFTFATLIKTFEAEWGLSKVEQGWISGIYFAGYTVAVPVLMAITDRLDARRIYLAGTAIMAAGAAGFMLFADGFWTALLFRAVSGFGLAGAYMPGLRVLVDRYRGANESRAIAFYTASWSLGTAFSYLLAGLIGGAFGWKAAFGLAAGGAFLGFAVVLVFLGPVMPQQAHTKTRLLDFRPVFKNRRAMGYVLAYCAHTWELFAFRAWLVAFLAFSISQQAAPVVGWFAEPSRVATLTAIAAMIASVLGNELALRLERARVIAVIQLLTASLACVVGFLSDQSYATVAALTMFYAVMVQSDSSALTAGVIGAAEPGRRGATLAIHNVVGWSGGFVGPLLVGVVLGQFGRETVTGWGFAFIAMGGITFLGALAIFTLSVRRKGT